MLPVFRRFSQADFPTAPDWLGQVFGPLNVFCEQTVQALNKNLVIGQNVQGQSFSTGFTTPSNYAAGGFSVITWQYTGGGKPNSLMLGKLVRTDGSPILQPVSVAGGWSVNSNTNPYTITVTYIAGLDADTKYYVTLLAL